MTDPGTPYKKPPITEAVIAFHFSAPINPNIFDRFKNKRKSAFPKIEEMRNVSVTVGTETAVQQSVGGYKFTNADGLGTVILTTGQLSTVRLAPYADWDHLLDEARDNWNMLTKLTGHLPLKSLSARYINRIDIPLSDKASGVYLSDYFNLNLSYPENVFDTEIANWDVTTIVQSANKKFQHRIKFATLVPILIDRLALLLDIDTLTMEPIPANTEDVWPMFDALRQAKDACFEACITQATRRLFS